MSSTTIDRTESSTVTNPFQAALRQAEERERAEAAEAARLAEERRLQRAQKEAERQQQREQHRLEREQQEAQRKEREFQANAKRWVQDFFRSVASTATSRQWKSTAIVEAQAYAEALVRRSDVELPKIDPGMAKVIQSKFAYGLVLDQRHRQIIPENFFNGQRQDWFPALYERKLNETQR